MPIARSREDIRAVGHRLDGLPLLGLHDLASVVQVEIAGLTARVSERTLMRWARDGKRAPSGERVYLDAIRDGETWKSNSAAVARFLEAIKGGG